MMSTKRVCGTCVSFDHEEGAGCFNAVSIVEDGITRAVRPDDVCHYHKTRAEDEAEDRAIALFRTRLGLPPRKAPPNEND